MLFVNDERLIVLSENSNTASSCYVGPCDAQEAKPNVFSAKFKVSLAASALRFQLG